jgi:hypothetical protein
MGVFAPIVSHHSWAAQMFLLPALRHVCLEIQKPTLRPKFSVTLMPDTHTSHPKFQIHLKSSLDGRCRITPFHKQNSTIGNKSWVAPAEIHRNSTSVAKNQEQNLVSAGRTWSPVQPHAVDRHMEIIFCQFISQILIKMVKIYKKRLTSAPSITSPAFSPQPSTNRV